MFPTAASAGNQRSVTVAPNTSSTTATKSKPNPITKFFLRISSPKSPENPSSRHSPTNAVPAAMPSVTVAASQHYQSSTNTSIHKSGYSNSTSSNSSNMDVHYANPSMASTATLISTNGQQPTSTTVQSNSPSPSPATDTNSHHI